jgi:hypothetical protein
MEENLITLRLLGLDINVKFADFLKYGKILGESAAGYSLQIYQINYSDGISCMFLNKEKLSLLHVSLNEKFDDLTFA